MSKIFRLYQQGNETYSDWDSNQSFPYNQTARDTINDPDGASANHQITSIPSPFARIDLVKSAFAEVNKRGVDGKTIFHKMVSDTFDIAEIFFNIDKHRNKVEIIVWNKDEMLQELENSDLAGHKYLADALRKYFLSDADVYNFNELRNIYLLNYINGPEQLNIIGATSPVTLFFSTANSIDYINDIQFGNDKPFDAEYQPLYKRDPEFVKYLYTLSKGTRGFGTKFREFNSYLEETYKKIVNQELKKELQSVNDVNVAAQKIDAMRKIDIPGTNDEVEVLGICLRKKPESRPMSDFSIESHLVADTETDPLPLVLPIEKGSKYADLQYVTDVWGDENQAPYIDTENDLQKRFLPHDGKKFPYLTISDFLEDTLTKIPHKLNTNNFYAGNVNVDANSKISFLLPIKPLFFKYFTADELKGNLSDGKPMFEMEINAGGTVSVTIRIPIKGKGRLNYVEYKRRYNTTPETRIDKNEGGTVEIDFAGLVMPLVDFADEKDAIYNVACFQSLSNNNKFEFYKGTEKLPTVSSDRGDEQQITFKSSNYLLKTKFDYIQVVTPLGENGIIVPNFKKQKSYDVFKFAVDLGTTTTHIEFAKNGETSSQPFSFSKNDELVGKMFDMVYKSGLESDEMLTEVNQIIEKDFVPAEVGTGDFKFPSRTVLAHAKSIDWHSKNEPFLLSNVSLTYEKRRPLLHDEYKSDIKWNNEQSMKLFVRCLMLMLRNKVLLNNGDLRKTEIVWFYPISMTNARREILKDTWDKAYKEYFGGQASNCSSMDEAVAPVQYVFRNQRSAKDIVNIDIGGGTTDVAFAAKEGNIDYITSFKFATNDLFADSYSVSNKNGIVDYFKTEFEQLFSLNNELKLIFNSIKEPTNLASFFFSLKDNTLLAKVDDDAKDFNAKLLRDGDFKVPVLIFYVSIIYHIAQITKVMNIPVPRHISFCGNGSKIVRTISSDSRLLANFTKKIFELVRGEKYDKQLDLLGIDDSENPKESTCKGGIVANTEKVQETEAKQLILNSIGTAMIEDESYDSVDNVYLSNVVEAVEEFFDFVLDDLNREFKFNDNFGIDNRTLKIARETLKYDLRTYLEKGIEIRKQDIGEDEKIGETFFFYAIKGALQSLSEKIYECKIN